MVAIPRAPPNSSWMGLPRPKLEGSSVDSSRGRSVALKSWKPQPNKTGQAATCQVVCRGLTDTWLTPGGVLKQILSALAFATPRSPASGGEALSETSAGKPRPAPLVRQLERFAADYERELSRLDTERDKLRARRDHEIRAAAKELHEEEIARILGLSPQLVHGLARRKV
jgi:hypothetical protein